MTTPEAAAPRSGEGLRGVRDVVVGLPCLGNHTGGTPCDRNVVWRTAVLEAIDAAIEAEAAAPRSGDGLDDAYRRGFTDGRGEPPEHGTVTQCPIEGVHEHAFRGPHGFREWLEGLDAADRHEGPTPRDCPECLRLHDDES